MKQIKYLMVALTLLFIQPAFAHHGEDPNFAEYNVALGVSPFGGSLNFSHNISHKTTYLAAVGGIDGIEMDLGIDGTDYTVGSKSAWVGFFVNHRPFKNASWFRVVGGVGFGSIENELTDADGNRYRADYNDNPVGYFGVGFGAGTDKGFSIGFDIGTLYTSGPDVSQVDGLENKAAVESISNHFFFGSVLPNAQLTLGWGF